jgi:GNAT superfamily N-acetyltransferase
MIEFIHEPPLDARPKPRFVQTIRLMDGRNRLGVATWFAPGDKHGVAQILSLEIEPPHRRQGHGRRLLAATAAQVIEYHRRQGLAARRLWALLAHKDHIIARAFLTANGFHHVSSLADLLDKQDGLIYSRAFD